MTRALAGGALLGLGITLALLLGARPALASPMLRTINARGRQVTAIPGLFPALAVSAVASIAAFAEPGATSILAVAVAVSFAACGVISDVAGGRVATRAGVDAAGLPVAAEVFVAASVGAAIAPDRAGQAAIAVAIVAATSIARGPLPNGVGAGLAVAAFVPSAIAGPGTPAVEAVAPAFASAAVLVPLEARARLRLGRGGAGSLGALAALIGMIELRGGWRIGVAVGLAVGAIAIQVWGRRRGMMHPFPG